MHSCTIMQQWPIKLAIVQAKLVYSEFPLVCMPIYLFIAIRGYCREGDLMVNEVSTPTLMFLWAIFWYPIFVFVLYFLMSYFCICVVCIIVYRSLYFCICLDILLFLYMLNLSLNLYHFNVSIIVIWSFCCMLITLGFSFHLTCFVNPSRLWKLCK